jgi:hypothetical protein
MKHFTLLIANGSWLLGKEPDVLTVRSGFSTTSAILPCGSSAVLWQTLYDLRIIFPVFVAKYKGAKV